METYQHILVVANCTKEDESALIQQVKHLIDPQQTRVSLVHILPNIPAYYLQCPALLELEKQLKSKARLNLECFAQSLGLENCSYYIKVGDFEREINSLAKELQVELIVMVKSSVSNILIQLWRKLLHIKSKSEHKKVCIQSLLV